MNTIEIYFYLNKENIMLTKNAGRKTYVEIRDFIKKNNFNFGDNIYGWTSENIEKIKEEFNNKIIENYNLRIKKIILINYFMK